MALVAASDAFVVAVLAEAAAFVSLVAASLALVVAVEALAAALVALVLASLALVSQSMPVSMQWLQRLPH